MVLQDGKVSISLQFTTVEAAQLLSIGTSMVSLAWCYSEYHSVRWIHDTGYRILDTGYWIQDTGYRILDTGYMTQDTGYRVQDTGYWV